MQMIVSFDSGLFVRSILEQLIALLTFFAFPIIQYVLLRRLALNKGNPLLWFLPNHGLRIVIGNIPSNRDLINLKLAAKLRTRIPRPEEKSVGDLYEQVLLSREELFLFAHTDEIIICFRLERSLNGIDLIVTDKLGVEKDRYPLSSFDKLICDYTAELKNFFNFDVKLAKRVELNSATLSKILEKIESDTSKKRRSFPFDKIRSIG